MKTTKKHLNFVIDLINDATESDTYLLDFAYGGFRLVQMVQKSKGGGQRNITQRGTKSECYQVMKCYLAGIEAGKKQIK